jgi:hypothetical protein
LLSVPSGAQPLQNIVLVHPLGQFTSKVSSPWLWKYSPVEQRLFVPYNRQWSFYHVVSGNRQSVNRMYHRGGTSHALPPDSRAATVSTYGSLVMLISFGMSALAPQVDPVLSFLQILDSLPAPSIWAIQEYALPSDSGPIIHSLSLGTSRTISDRSYKDKFGTSAFTILDNQDNSILSLDVVPGHPDNQGAYHSELPGLFGIVLVVNRLCSWAGIESGGIEVGCDGLSALEKAFDTWSLEPTDPHFDMLTSLRTQNSCKPGYMDDPAYPRDICESILAAVRSEYSVGRSSLPRRDWRLFQRPLLSILSSSLHYLDAWLLRVKTARSQQARQAADLANPSVNTAEEHFPNLAGSRRIFQQFLNSVSPP